MLRSCGEAETSSACDTAGHSFSTRAFSAVSLMRSSAPSRSPAAALVMPKKGSRLISTTCEWFSTWAFIKSTSAVPPAMKAACGSALQAAPAC